MHALLFNLKSRSNEGGGGSAVKPTAAASAGFLYEESVQAAAATDSVRVAATALLWYARCACGRRFWCCD